jgi:hypothetical protein
VGYFGAGFFGCEHPFDEGAAFVSLAFPCGNLRYKQLPVIDAPIEALGTQDADQLACLGV